MTPRSPTSSVLSFLGIVCALALSPASDLEAQDRRSHELLSYECRNELGRRDITLFANGTVRVRDGLWEDQRVALDEMGPDELAEIVDILESVDVKTATPPTASVQGQFSEECSLELNLKGRSPWQIRFSRWAIPPVVASRLVQIAEDLAVGTEIPELVHRLPEDYVPRPGDIIRSREGQEWEVLRWTSDRQGLELQAKSQPLRIFVSLEQLDELFEAIVGRTRR